MSIPIQFLLNKAATSATVPEPKNGSRIISPSWLPAKIQGCIKAGGKAAK